MVDVGLAKAEQDKDVEAVIYCLRGRSGGVVVAGTLLAAAARRR